MANGALLTEINSFPKWDGIEEISEKSGWQKVQVLSAALNRRDYWITKGMYPNITFPIVLGSDLVGNFRDQKVVVNPGFDWGIEESHQSSEFHVLGLPTNGTIAEYCHVPESHIYPCPIHLNQNEAAALPLAGVTAYRAVFTQGELVKGQKILITGVGGGVATFCLLFAVAAGADVYVTSSSSQKIEKAVQLGAKQGFNYKEESYEKELKKITGGLDLVIDSAGGDGFSRLVSCVNPGGRMVFYGGTRGKINNINPQLIFWRQITIQGTTMGSPLDFENMLNFVNKHKIVPVVDSVFTTDQLTEAFEHLEKNHQFGKIVIRIQE